MRRIKSFPSVKKLATLSVASCFLFLPFCRTALGSQTILSDGQSVELDGPLVGDMKDRFGDGWSRAFIVGKDGLRLQLFAEEQLSQSGGVVFESFDRRDVSPTGRYVVLSVVRQGTLEVLGEKPRIAGREYCPVIEVKTGCIVAMQTGEICGGEWASRGDAWLNGRVDRTVEMMTKTTSDAKRLWHEFSNASVHLNLRDMVTSNLGISNVMACDPPNYDNRQSYLAIAGQLRDEKAMSEADYVESRVAPLSGHSVANGKRFRIGVDRAWLYDSPRAEAKTKMYVVKGDIVTAIASTGGGWLQVDYAGSTCRILRKWIRIDTVAPLAEFKRE
jgi:hypothetical protein